MWVPLAILAVPLRHGDGAFAIAFLDAAVELMRRKPDLDAHFFILGERPGDALEDLKRRIAASAQASRFRLVAEDADPATRYPYYWIADICVTDCAFALS